MPPTEVYELHEGERIPLTPSGAEPSSAAGQQDAAVPSGTGSPGATGVPPAGDTPPPVSPAGQPPPVSGEGTGEPDDADSPDDTPITAGYVNRRISRLVRQRHDAERALEAERAENRLRQTQMQGQLELLTRMPAGQAPTPPEPPNSCVSSAAISAPLTNSDDTAS